MKKVHYNGFADKQISPQKRMKQYYLHIEGQTYGPYPHDQLVGLVEDGQVSKASLICEAGGESWVEAKTLLVEKPKQPTAVAVAPPIPSPEPKKKESSSPASEQTASAPIKSEEQKSGVAKEKEEDTDSIRTTKSSRPRGGKNKGRSKKSEPIEVTDELVKSAFSKLKFPVIVLAVSIIIPVLFYMIKLDLENGDQIQAGTTVGVVHQFLRDHTSRFPEVLGLGTAGAVYGVMWFGKQMSYYSRVKAAYKKQK